MKQIEKNIDLSDNFSLRKQHRNVISSFIATVLKIAIPYISSNNLFIESAVD